MVNKLMFVFLSSTVLFSCMSTNISKFYSQNQAALDQINETYKTEYFKSPFSLEYIDKSFKNISIEIFTDSLKYIYVFADGESRLNDTLRKYHIHQQGVERLLQNMRSVHCNWVNNLDYYVDRRKNSLVFMSIRPIGFHFPFRRKKYYILTYFSQPQYYDDQGRLLDKRRRRKIRKINEEVFKRITDKVAYSVSDRFR